MDKMNVFSDTISESFGYQEIKWEGNTYMVDFNSKDSVEKLLFLITGESNLDDCLSSLINLSNQPEFLNTLISAISSEILDNTKYKKFHEDCGLANWVLYRKDQFDIKSFDGKTLHLRCLDDALGQRLEQPINISSLFCMFFRCSDVCTLDLSHWDVSAVTDLICTFTRCESLVSLNIANWDTCNVKSMRCMFDNCESLASLNLANWNVSEVEDMGRMFNKCSSLGLLDVSKWDVGNVKYLDYMFADCYALTSLDLANWDVSNISSCTSMFEDCENLVELNLSNWSLNPNADVQDMFRGCTSLVTTHNAELDANLGNT